MFLFTDKCLFLGILLNNLSWKVKGIQKHMNFLCKKSYFSQSPVQGCKATGDYKANICFHLENVEIDLNNQCKTKLVLL